MLFFDFVANLKIKSILANQHKVQNTVVYPWNLLSNPKYSQKVNGNAPTTLGYSVFRDYYFV